MTRKITLGLIGYGTVGSGVATFFHKRKKFLKDKFQTEFIIKTICDRSLHKKNISSLKGTQSTSDFQTILKDPEIDVVVELIGGMKPAKEIVTKSLRQGKHVITANKELIANSGKELFTLAQKHQRHLYYESAVGAGIPIIKSMSEGIAGNAYQGIYGIINGTCNFILSEMSEKHCSFDDALKEAQRRGFAESDPTLDVNGMDATHKLAILTNLAFGKFLNVKDIYTEGITHIAHTDIEHAESLNLTIKLLAIAKKKGTTIEARVHPTLISKQHALAAINGVDNAIYLHTDLMGDIMLSGEGAGQQAAASGVISDLINLATRDSQAPLMCNQFNDNTQLTLGNINDITTKFYLRFMAMDKPGVLSKITGILGQHRISINSMTQKTHNPSAVVPVIMLTEAAKEKELHKALQEIHKLSIIKNKPVAIRLEEN